MYLDAPYCAKIKLLNENLQALCENFVLRSIKSIDAIRQLDYMVTSKNYLIRKKLRSLVLVLVFLIWLEVSCRLNALFVCLLCSKMTSKKNFSHQLFSPPNSYFYFPKGYITIGDLKIKIKNEWFVKFYSDLTEFVFLPTLKISSNFVSIRLQASRKATLIHKYRQHSKTYILILCMHTKYIM